MPGVSQRGQRAGLLVARAFVRLWFAVSFRHRRPVRHLVLLPLPGPPSNLWEWTIEIADSRVWVDPESKPGLPTGRVLSDRDRKQLVPLLSLWGKAGEVIHHRH